MIQIISDSGVRYADDLDSALAMMVADADYTLVINAEAETR